MKVRKLVASLILSIVTLAVPFTSVFAASGWQYIDRVHITTWNSTLNKYKSPIVHSGGGYVKVCAIVSSSTAKDFTLYSYNPGSGNDKKIGSIYLKNGQCTQWYVAPYVDGSNKKAEIYLASSYGIAGADIWD